MKASAGSSTEKKLGLMFQPFCGVLKAREHAARRNQWTGHFFRSRSDFDEIRACI